MARITDLPPEILGQIFEEETTDSAKHNRSLFVRLLRVNHLFYNVVTPLLYRKLSTNGFSTNGMWETGLWARTLLEDEAKLALVQHVEIFANSHGRGWTPPREDRLDPLRDLDKSGLRRLHALVTSAFENTEDTRDLFIKRACEEHCIEYVLAILVANLPALRVIRQRRWTDLFWSCLEDVSNGLSARAKDLGSRQPFEALRIVKIDHSFNGQYVTEEEGWPQDWPQPSNTIGITASWPRVQILIAESTGDDRDDQKISLVYRDLKPRSSDLKAILLGHSSELHAEHLLRLLDTPRALEIFYYHIGSGYHIGSEKWNTTPFGITGIHVALSQQSHSLKHVALHLRWPENGSGARWDAMSFRGFVKLQSLQITFALLFGSENITNRHWACQHIAAALPPSMETLTVGQCFQEVQVEITLDAYDYLIRCKNDEASSIKTLRVGVPMSGRGCIGVAEEELLKFAKGLYAARHLDLARDPRIELIWHSSSYHSGIQVLPLDYVMFSDDEFEFEEHGWKRSGVRDCLSGMRFEGLDAVLSGHERCD